MFRSFKQRSVSRISATPARSSAPSTVSPLLVIVPSSFHTAFFPSAGATLSRCAHNSIGSPSPSSFAKIFPAFPPVLFQVSSSVYGISSSSRTASTASAISRSLRDALSIPVRYRNSSATLFSSDFSFMLRPLFLLVRSALSAIVPTIRYLIFSVNQTFFFFFRILTEPGKSSAKLR